MADQPNKALESEAVLRRQEAWFWKSRRLLDFKECYFFSHPDRQRQLSSQTKPSTQTMLDAPELNTDVAFLLCDDATTEIVNTYMPEAQIWCERAPGMDVREDVFDQVRDDVKEQDKKIFAAIKASNFYAELPKALNPDLFIGAAGLWIHRPEPSLPIEVLAVPIREMEINLGPNGEIDDRFVIRWARNAHVRALLGGELYDKLDDETRRDIETNAAADQSRKELVWGFWRLWDRKDDEVWQHVVLIGKKLLHSAELVGQGSCPFLPFRFGATADWPWAIPPLVKSLPTLRQFDELERQKIEAVERAVSPSLSWPDDSFSLVEQGFEPNMAYPIRPGTQDTIKTLWEQPSVQPEIFQTEYMEHRLRKMFYVDYPEQTGDTPPTASQWLDELARAQRRIGTAGQSFWREGPMRIFLRYKYLLEKSGTIKPIGDRSGRAISTQPYNPAQRAGEQQEIATAVQFLNLALQIFPEEARMAIDGTMTMRRLAEKMRVAGERGMIVFRDPQKTQAILGQISQLIGGRQKAGNGMVPPEAGAPAPV